MALLEEVYQEGRALRFQKTIQMRSLCFLFGDQDGSLCVHLRLTACTGHDVVITATEK